MLEPEQRGHFVKLGLRRAQAISVINLAVVITFNGDQVQRCRIALGCLAPTVVRARTAEAYLAGKRLSAAVCAEAARLACEDVHPIGDLRGSAGYRLATLAALLAETLERLASGGSAPDLAAASVLLDTGDDAPAGTAFDGVIDTTINGRSCRLEGATGKTLLDALREDAGLTGTKEGCAEGECGACTVWLNGQAVMSCLVPAPQAHNAAADHDRGSARGQSPASTAGSICRLWRRAVRLLHSRHADGGRQAAGRASHARSGTGTDRVERQYLPLYRLPQDSRRHGQRRGGGTMTRDRRLRPTARCAGQSHR